MHCYCEWMRPSFPCIPDPSFPPSFPHLPLTLLPASNLTRHVAPPSTIPLYRPYCSFTSAVAMRSSPRACATYMRLGRLGKHPPAQREGRLMAAQPALNTLLPEPTPLNPGAHAAVSCCCESSCPQAPECRCWTWSTHSRWVAMGQCGSSTRCMTRSMRSLPASASHAPAPPLG